MTESQGFTTAEQRAWFDKYHTQLVPEVQIRFEVLLHRVENWEMWADNHNCYDEVGDV